MPETRAPNGIEAATAARLRYVSDDAPGITRRRAGKGFSYRDIEGETVRDAKVRERIEKLAIPPAWTDVWICTSPSGHIQATGRDDRERKQYLYHERWREIRDAHKYDRLVTFAAVLPAIRERTDSDLRLRGLPREKVLAGVVRLLEATLIRIGNQEYARVNESFGLTTLRSKHVDLKGSRIDFQFTGKGGKEHQVNITDRRLAQLVKQCLEIPGWEVFRYFDDDGERHLIESNDVNQYLQEISGESLTAKDFRTWGGTLIGARELASQPAPASDKEATVTINAAIECIATRLGNTPAICRKCYVHPAIFDAYRDGGLQKAFAAASAAGGQADPHALDPEETAMLGILKKRPVLERIASLKTA